MRYIFLIAWKKIFFFLIIPFLNKSWTEAYNELPGNVTGSFAI